MPNTFYVADARDCQNSEAIMSMNVNNQKNNQKKNSRKNNQQGQEALSNGNTQTITHQSNSSGGATKNKSGDGSSTATKSKTKTKVNLLYSRLSKDDEMQGPSNSIVNQQHLLQEYA